MEEFFRTSSLEISSFLPLLVFLGLILFFIFLPKFRQKALRFNLEFWEKRKRVKLSSKKIWVAWFLIIITSGLIALALTNPQIVTRKRTSVIISRPPVMVVLDVSGSMAPISHRYHRPPDYGYSSFSKFGAAKEVFYNITEKDLGVSFGLMLFSTETYLARDFTAKPELLKGVLEDADKIDRMSSGTETALALAEARRILTQKGEDLDKAIILIADLEDILREIGQEMRRGLEIGLRYYVILVQPSGTGIPDIQATLEIEARGKIQLVWVGDSEGIDQICQEISKMKGIYEEKEEIVSRQSLIRFLLPPIIVLTVILIILSETIFRKIP